MSLLLVSAFVAGSGIVSLVLDFRSIHLAYSARRSTLVVHLVRQEAWWRNEALPARVIAGQGAALFTDAGCAYCHIIRGVAAAPSRFAPELTHFAARGTIVAMDLPNQRGNLDGWIVNSRAIKHGSG